MTEAQAKTKWCPHARVRDAGVPAAVNRLSNRAEECLCVGSECMVWRGTPMSGWCGLAGQIGAP